MTDRNNHSPNIVYFAMRSTRDGEGHIGAALVVDTKGIPLEFRCSVPVRPSAVQAVLYGAPIRDYIVFNLCGQPLLESITTNPAVCLVESELDFNLQEHVSIPVIYAYRAEFSSDSDLGNVCREGSTQHTQLLQSRQPNEHAAVPDAEMINQGGADCIYLQSPANFEPVVLKSYPNWNRSLQDLLPDLRRLFSSIDLVEPFNRITASCRLLCQEDERFK